MMMAESEEAVEVVELLDSPFGDEEEVVVTSPLPLYTDIVEIEEEEEEGEGEETATEEEEAVTLSHAHAQPPPELIERRSEVMEIVIDESVYCQQAEEEGIEGQFKYYDEGEEADAENHSSGVEDSTHQAHHHHHEEEEQQKQILIYMKPSVTNRKQIKIHKCGQCELSFGSPALLNSHFHTVHERGWLREVPGSAERIARECEMMSSKNINKKRESSKARSRSNSNSTSSNPNPNANPTSNSNSEESLISCSRCNKIFKRPADLVRHFISIHNSNGRKNYKCKDCDKGFVRKDNLQRHERTHNPKRTLYSCEACQKLFTRKFDTIRHYLLVHK